MSNMLIKVVYFEIYRLVRAHWVLIRTRIESLEVARTLLVRAQNEDSSFQYKLCQVTIVDLPNEGHD